jgi:uncharacterized protein with von Willebrand factor type A (vWA) domain
MRAVLIRYTTVLPALLGFVHRLRDAGIPVSMVETLDAVESMRHIDLACRGQLKATLGAALVKRAEHQPVFAQLFDIHFGLRRPEASGKATVMTAGPASTEREGAADALLEGLLDALRRNDRDALRALAMHAVEQWGGIDTTRSDSTRYHLYRVLRQLDLSNLLKRAIREDRPEPDDLDPLEQRLVREEHERRVEDLRQLIAGAIRERLVERGEPGGAGGMLETTLVEDRDILTASPAEIREMRAVVRPLARKLAARIAHRRRFRRRGRLDVRRTIRRSLSAGGTLLEPAFRTRKVSRPQLVLLCDVSGSVAEFARFTLSLLHAMTEEFPRIRSFAFVDGIDEVTEELTREGVPLDLPQVLARASVIWSDGHSDYGRVFARFWQLHGPSALGPKATVIITGDARNNYRDPRVDALCAIKARARKLYWLNPEPRREWNTTDSIMATYAPCCDGVFEVRTLRRLAAFVDRIA